LLKLRGGAILEAYREVFMRRALLAAALALYGCPEPPPPPLPVCGDGVLDAGEECDDGNTVDADDCQASCSLPRCGDLIVDAGIGEECDDGNVIEADGCSNFCQFQSQVVAEDVRGLNVNDAIFAFFDDEGPFRNDGDGDGEPDRSFTVLTVAVSTDESFCDDFTAAGGAEDLTDFEVLFIQAVKFAALDVGLIEGETIVGDENAATQVLVAEVIRVNGSNQLLVENALDGSVTLDVFDPGAELSLSFDAVLSRDTTSVVDFDTDLDGDGLFDFKAVNALVSGVVVRASHCEAL
jgi:cysteine-rich repeat protein